jgi:hypothetical protein
MCLSLRKKKDGREGRMEEGKGRKRNKTCLPVPNSSIP